MSADEAEAIAAVPVPATAGSVVRDLHALGLAVGDVVIVHTSMSRLGWIAGGAQAVVEALLQAVGATGTVVMPTQSGQLSDPATWSNPPVPADWQQAIRKGFPAYDPYLTPTRGMGQVVECFRVHRSTLRSAHPLVSFAANGPQAHEILEPHALTPALGDASPLGRLYQLDAKVLLLGVDHSTDTSLHLAEYRAEWPSKRRITEGAPLLVDGRRTWVTYDDLDLDTDDFAAVGDAFARAGGERRGPVAGGTGRLARQRALIDFATAWFAAQRH